MSEQKINCSDCCVLMSPIKIIDATEKMLGQATSHVELAYAAAGAEPGFFSGRISELGVVRGFICPKCGQIKLYGERSNNG